MSSHLSVIGYFWYAGWVVKSVMFILLMGSIASWMYIFERAWYFKSQSRLTEAFLKRFWKSNSLNRLFTDMEESGDTGGGASALFYQGFKEFMRQKNQASASITVGTIERAMQIAYAKEAAQLEKRLAFFASVGSIAPYIGLFGTVWGIMTSFQALGQAQQATIAMVAPGISEALVATALGLFTAIPAVIAYNRYTTIMGVLLEQYELFQQELLALIEQQL